MKYGIAYRVCHWFWELGQVYTMSDWARDTKQVYLQIQRDNIEMRKVFDGLILK